MERRATLTADLAPELPDEERERRQLEDEEDVVGVSGARVAHIESAVDFADMSPPPPERMERRSSRFAVTPVPGDVGGLPAAAGAGAGGEPPAELQVVAEVDGGAGSGEEESVKAPLAQPETVESPQVARPAEKSTPELTTEPTPEPERQPTQKPAREPTKESSLEPSETEQEPLLAPNDRPRFTVDTDDSEDVSVVSLCS